MSDFCNLYIDDIVVFSRTVEKHIGYLQQMFDHLRAVGLKLQTTKFEFAYSRVTYVGYVIVADGILPNPEKVRAVLEFRHATGYA